MCSIPSKIILILIIEDVEITCSKKKIARFLSKQKVMPLLVSNSNIPTKNSQATKSTLCLCQRKFTEKIKEPLLANAK